MARSGEIAAAEVLRAPPRCALCDGRGHVVVVTCVRCLKAAWFDGAVPDACEACETGDCPVCHPTATGAMAR